MDEIKREIRFTCSERYDINGTIIKNLRDTDGTVLYVKVGHEDWERIEKDEKSV